MKKFERISSLVLAILMCLSLVAVPAFAEETGADPTGPEYIINEEFEDFATDGPIAPNDNIQAVSLEQTKVLSEEGAHGKFVRIPYAGHSAAFGGGDNTGNADRNITGKHGAISYTQGETLIVEADYRWHNAGLPARMECQFRNITSDTAKLVEGVRDGTVDQTGKSTDWISLFFIMTATNSLANCGTLTGAGELIPDEWNNIRLIINMIDGTYDTYVNGVLYAQRGFISGGNQDDNLINIVVNANKFYFGKCSKGPGIYNEDTGNGAYDCYMDMDNVRIYFADNLVDVTMNGMDMKVFQDQKIDFGKAGSTFLSAVITKKSDGIPVLTLENSYVVTEPVDIEVEYVTGSFYAYEDFALMTAGAALTATSGHGFAGDLPAEGAYAVEFDEETENTYLKIPFKGAEGSETGVGAGSYVDKNMYIAHDEISYADHPAISTTAKYFFSEGSNGAVEAQLQEAKVIKDNKETTVNWLSLYILKANAEGNIEFIKNSGGDVVADAVAPKTNTWFTVKTVISLVDGSFCVYVDGVLYMTGCKLNNGATNFIIAASHFAPAKLNKLTTAEITAFTADSYFLVDDIGIGDAPVVSFKVNGETITEFQGLIYNFKKVGGIFASAKYIDEMTEEEKALSVDEKGEPLKDNKGNVITTVERTLTQNGIAVTPAIEGEEYTVEFVTVLGENDFEGENLVGDYGYATLTTTKYEVYRKSDGKKEFCLFVPVADGVEAPQYATGEKVNPGFAYIAKSNSMATVQELIPTTEAFTVSAYQGIYDVITGCTAFEGYEVDGKATLKVIDGFKTGLVKYSVVTEEENSFIHIPFEGAVASVGGAGRANSGNADQYLYLNQLEASYETGAEVVYSTRIRYSYDDTSKDPCVAFGFKASGIYATPGTVETKTPYLYQLNTKTGALSYFAAGAKSAGTLEAGKWYDIKVIMNIETGYYDLFIDNVLVTGEVQGQITHEGQNSAIGTNLTIVANTAFVKMLNAQDSYQKDSTTAIDVDNFEVRYRENVSIKLAGSEKSYPENSIINLEKEDSRLIFAVLVDNGVISYTDETKFVAVEGLDLTGYYISNFYMVEGATMRLGTPEGMRFAAAINGKQLNNIVYATNGAEKEEDQVTYVKEAKVGTLISPVEYVQAAGAFTKKALDEKYTDGKGYIDVASKLGKYYYGISGVASTDNVFAASISNIKEANYTKDFVAVTYLTLTLSNDQVITIYADYDLEKNAANVSEVAAATLASNPRFANSLVKSMVESYVVKAAE